MHEFIDQIEKARKLYPRFMIPGPDGEPYLERVVLEVRPDGSKTYLHTIYQSDGDREPHDHPWDFESQIIWGSYLEHQFEVLCSVHNITDSCPAVKRLVRTSKVFGPGDLNKKKAPSLHRLELLKGPVVTLVNRGPKVRDWGFWCDSGWMSHRDYLDKKFGKGNWNEDYE